MTASKFWQIVEFSKKHLYQAARIYAKGLLMEQPPGSKESLEKLTESLRLQLENFLLESKEGRSIWLAFEGASIVGLVDFLHKPDELFIRFICAIPPRQGTGTRLLRHLAKFGQAHHIDAIRTTVSSIDQRALNFYIEHLGFERIGTRIEEPGFELYVITIQPKDLLEKI